MVDISIVIPCYNSEKYIINLLDILYRQKDSLFELILVDDSSTDSTLDIINKYNFRDNTSIKIISNDSNLGPGESRNKAIKCAAGKYITFIDSDDYVDIDFVETIKNAIACYRETDVFFFDFIIEKENTKKRLCMHIGAHFTADDNKYVDVDDALVFVRGATRGKVYRTALLRENDIYFLKLKRGEDIPFTKSAISKAEKIVYLKKPVYYYVQRSDSLIHEKVKFDVRDTINRFFEVKKRTEEKFPNETEAMFIIHCLYSAVMNSTKRGMKRKEVKAIVNKLSGIYPKWKNNIYIKKFPRKYRIALFLIKIKAFFIIRIASKIYYTG